MFWCQQHERVADALFGSTAEMLTSKEALSRRIQVISDLVALCGLREPSRRGPKMDKIDWSQFEEPIDLNDLEASTTRSTDEAKSEDSPQIDELAFPIDQYIFCAGDVTLRTFSSANETATRLTPASREESASPSILPDRPCVLSLSRLQRHRRPPFP
jgi:hypothetical protein